MSDDKQIDVHLLWQELGVMRHPICDDARTVIERLTAEVAALKTEVKTANTRLEAEQWARQHVKSVIVGDLEPALRTAEAEAARLREGLERVKDHAEFNGLLVLQEIVAKALRGEEGCPPPPPQGSEG